MEDKVGRILKAFYAEFGIPNEGPREDMNVSALLGSQSIPEAEFRLLETALADVPMKRKFRQCQELLDELATILTATDFMQELTQHAQVSPDDFEHLASGVLWSFMASSLDKRAPDGLPESPFPNLELPLEIRVLLTIQGSLILWLYVSLVYAREGAFWRAIDTAAKARCPLAGRVRRFLNCDYTRHLRNALSHGSIAPTIAGLCFRDGPHMTIATPSFLKHMATFLSLCQLQVMAASARADEVHLKVI